MSEEQKPSKEPTAADAEAKEAKKAPESESDTQAESVTETESATEAESATETESHDLKMESLYCFKVGMSTIYEGEEAVPVTALRYEPWFVTQIKSNETDGYESIQIGCKNKKSKRTLKPERGHAQASGVFENAPHLLREVRQGLPEDVCLGQKVAIDSLESGDVVQMTSKSKGRGFAGAMKRYNFGGGPASHGSGFHRRPGSAGNRTWPGRVVPGKRMPGHYGDKNITVKNVRVVAVIAEENVVLVKGPVPGARNTLVKLVKSN